MNLKQRIVVLAMDVLLLAELAVCMYQAQSCPDHLTAVFLKTYLPAAGATLLAAWLLIRRLGRPAAGEPAGVSADIQ